MWCQHVEGSSRCFLTEANELLLKNISGDDEGYWTCVVGNDVGEVSVSIDIYKYSNRGKNLGQ